MKTARPIGKQGIALVATLAILVMATILVVGFVGSMRTERQAATTMANNASAAIVAQAAVDHATALLEKNIPQPVAPGASTANPVNWIINPGLLTTVQGTNPATQIPLSSNPSASYSSTAQDAELNVPLLSGSGHSILGTSAPMRVAWIPMLRDPTTAASLTNQISARYGFWMDDENAKINLNTSYGKPATLDFSKLTPGTISVNSGSTTTYPLGFPSSVNLDVLNSASTQIDASSIATAVGIEGGLTAIDEVKAHLGSGNANAFFDANKFFLTTSSRDPEFNVFGKSRFYLFRRILDSATGKTVHPIGQPMIQVFRDLEAPMYFHEDEAGTADTSALYYTAASIAGRTAGTTIIPGILSRADWPGMPATSFVDKWDKDASGTPYSTIYPGLLAGDMGKREADQVAWNIVSMGSFSDYQTGYSNTTSGDYVSFQNKIAAGQPGSAGTVNYPNAALPVGPLSQKAIIPAFPRPLVNEICLTVSLEPTPPTFPGKFRMKVWLQTELWLGPGYPDCNFSAPGAAAEVGLTYLYYTASQDGNSDPDLPVTQEDTKYIKSTDQDGIRSLFGSITSGTLPSTGNPPSRYTVLTTQGAPGAASATNKWIYVRKNPGNGGFSSSTTGPFNFEASGIIHATFRMRLFEHSPAGTTPTAPPTSLVPIWDARDPKTSSANTWNVPPPASPLVPAFAPPKDDQKDYIEFKFDINPASLGGQTITRSKEIADPRMGGLARMWMSSLGFTNPDNPKADTLGGPNSIATADTSKIAWVDFSNPSGTSAGSIYRPTVGMFSLIPTGMQRGIAGSTLKLQPSGSNTDLPDWLLLDLLAPTAEASNYSNVSFMNSTAGKVNLNAPIFPNGGSFTPPERWQPLQAVFQNMSPSSTISAGSTLASPIVDNILKHKLANPNGVDFGALNVYDYPGEVCEIAGVADSGLSDWDKEAIVRYVASNLTTKSNVFSVWGVAQTVKKNPANKDPAMQGTFQTKIPGVTADDSVTGEKRFQAIIERYVWPGKDASPGNAHVTGSGGSYDKLSSGQTQPGNVPAYSGGTWETLDGPDAPTYPVNTTSGAWNQNALNSFSSSSIDTANNPLRAVMKYRVISFKYLTE